MSLSLRPLADRVVVEPSQGEERTESGLYIPETAKEKPQEGTIIAVGPGRRDDSGTRTALDVEVGQTVMYAKYGGTEIKIDGQKLLILKESDILAVVTK